MELESINSDERRGFERFSARFPAKFKDSREDYGANVSLRDACASGAKLSTKEKMYLYDKVTLEVNLPDNGLPMTIKGEVVWVKNCEPNFWDVGLKFHKIDLMHIARLYKFAEI